MKQVLIEFQSGCEVPRGNRAMILFSESNNLKSINFMGTPPKSLSGKQWDDLHNEIFKAVENAKGETAPVVSNPENLPAMSKSQAVAFVFKGGGGFSGLLDRLAKVGEIAKAEMSESEKEAADGLLKNLRKLSGK
jgi:hypothetical protein